MTVENITAPPSEPVLLAELKAHLRIDTADENPALAGFLVTARTLIEERYGLALVARSVLITLDAFPEAGALLPIRPVSSIEAIEVRTKDGSLVPWGADNYYLKSGLRPALHLKSGRLWPVPGPECGGVEITATAGFGLDWNSVPESIRQAILMLAAYLYTNRGEAAVEDAIKASGAAKLVNPYREYRL